MAIATIVDCVFSTQKDAKLLLQKSFARRFNSAIYSQLEKSQSSSLLLQSGNFILDGGQVLPLNNFLLLDTAQSQSSLQFKWQSFVDNLLQEFSELGGMLVLGSAIAAMI